jgi:hypothetical protein
MRVQANGKVRRSPEEWERIFERFRASGLSEAAFCRRAKLSTSSFAKWKRRLASEAETPRFVECTPAARPERSSLAAGEMELCLPKEITLRWKP